MDKLPSPEPVALSIVIPVHNEAENLLALGDALWEVLSGLEETWEVILVDDGSQDDSFAGLRKLHERDARFRVLRFRRNFGQAAAFAAGFAYARGEAVITMDADLQNDPHDIPMLLNTLRDGDYDVVSGWRVHREDSWIRRFPSRVANWLISWATGVHLHDYGCSLKAYRAEVVKNVHLYGELHRFIPALASWMGIRLKEVPVQHHARTHGKSKYNLSRVTRVLLDLLTVTFLLGYGVRPMQIFGRAGLYSTLIGFLLALYLTALKLFTGISLSRRPLLFLAILLIIVGVQLITIGLIGELVVRTYYEAQGKPIYVVRETLD